MKKTLYNIIKDFLSKFVTVDTVAVSEEKPISFEQYKQERLNTIKRFVDVLSKEKINGLDVIIQKVDKLIDNEINSDKYVNVFYSNVNSYRLLSESRITNINTFKEFIQLRNELATTNNKTSFNARKNLYKKIRRWLSYDDLVEFDVAVNNVELQFNADVPLDYYNQYTNMLKKVLSIVADDDVLFKLYINRIQANVDDMIDVSNKINKKNSKKIHAELIKIVKILYDDVKQIKEQMNEHQFEDVSEQRRVIENIYNRVDK